VDTTVGLSVNDSVEDSVGSGGGVVAVVRSVENV